MTPIAHGERLIVVVGPSGAGKDSVLDAWRRRLGPQAPVHFARRVVTRPADSGGEAHEAIDEDGFSRLLAAGELATTWRANGLRYGVRRSELRALAHGGWVVMNGSREHLPQLREQAPALRAVHITASGEVRAQRLARRGREDPAAIAHRLERDIQPQAGLVLHNDGELEAAVDTLQRWWRTLDAGIY